MTGARKASARAVAVAEALASSEGFVSGERLARASGVSRASVRKYVRRLIEAGAVIQARPGAGYRLAASPERPDALGIAAHRGRGGVGRAVRLGATVDHRAEAPSTNDLVVGEARIGAPEGAVVTADVQLGGRGRRGRRWESPAGGLYLSVLLRPPLPPTDITLLGLLGALALVRAIDALGIEGAAIKWPNDVTLGGKKIAGILVEASIDAERTAWAVLGLGVNVLRAPAGAGSGATSLAQAGGGSPPGRAAVAAAFLDALEALLDRLYARDPALVEEVSARCDTLGREVTVTDATGAVLEGTATGLADDGSLRLAVSGREVRLTSGDVQVRMRD